MPRRLWGFAAPKITNVLIAIILVLLLHAVVNLFSSVFSLFSQNLQGFLVYLVIAVIYAVPAYGLLNLNRWARLFQMAASLFLVITGLFSIFGGNRVVGAIAVVVHGLIAMYLLSDNCQQLFKLSKNKIQDEIAA